MRAKVLKVDTAGGKLSLGLKPSYFADEDDPMGSASDEEAEMDLDEELAEELDAAAAAAAAEVSCQRPKRTQRMHADDVSDDGVKLVIILKHSPDIKCLQLCHMHRVVTL